MSIIYEALNKTRQDKPDDLPMSEPNKRLPLKKFWHNLLVAILCFVILWFLSIHFKIVPGNKDASKSQAITQAYPAKAANINSVLSAHIPLSLPKQPKQKTPEDLVLSGILGSPDGNLAIINGRIVKQGDKIQDYEVTGITEKKVELEGKEGKKKNLRIK